MFYDFFLLCSITFKYVIRASILHLLHFLLSTSVFSLKPPKADVLLPHVPIIISLIGLLLFRIFHLLSSNSHWLLSRSGV